MKTKLFCLALLFAITTVSIHAQTSSASQAGIAVQGIARDANNTALASSTISFTFTIYYLDASSLEVLIFEETLNLNTDAFGVFSHVIDPTAVSNSKFGNYQAYLRIKKGTEIISNEKLKHVPYAISANNGVPTGSIMPFLGTTAPYGWALCDGSVLPTTATELIALVGANAPNLGGMFLRGAGGSGTHVGPALKATQEDGIETHTSTGSTTTTGNHTHTEKFRNLRQIDEEDDSYRANSNVGASGLATVNTGSTGAHNHNVSVTYTGVDETRPVNFGVNYIIKLNDCPQSYIRP